MIPGYLLPYGWLASVLMGLWLIGAEETQAQASVEDPLQLLPAPSRNHITENATRCMLKDHLGYLWIGTIEGLNRYDGYAFTRFEHSELDSTSLSGNYVSDLLEDRHGNLWVATFDGLSRYDRARGQFTQFYHHSQRPNSLAGNVVTKLAEDREGNLWVASYGGLSRYRPETRDFENFTPLGSASACLLDADVTCVVPGEAGGIWVGYQDGHLSRWQDGLFTHYLAEEIGTRGSINDIVEEAGRLWLGGDGGIFSFSKDRKRARQYMPHRVWSFARLRDGRLWANVNFKGIWAWNAAEDAFVPIPIEYEHEAIEGDIRIYLEDEQGIIWGSVRGLAKHDPYEKRFRHMAHVNGSKEGLTGNTALGIEEDGAGRIYVLTRPHGLNRYDPQTERWENCYNTPVLCNALREVRPGSDFLVTGEVVWSFFEGGWYQLNLETGVRTPMRILPPSERSSSTSIEEAANGEIWVLDHELARWSPQDGRWSTYSAQFPPKEDLKLLFTSEQGTLYVVGKRQLFRYVSQRDTFVALATLLGMESTRNDAICGLSDDETTVWLGRRTGLEVYDLASGTARRYTVEDGLAHNVVNALLADSMGNLWISTNNGLCVLDPASEQFRMYRRSDGLQDEIFLGRSALKSREGKFYFGGVNGLNVFEPREVLAINPHAPRVLITGVDVLDIPPDQPQPRLVEGPISKATALRIPHRYHTLRFDFLALSYTQSVHTQYAYKVEGMQDHWNQLNTQRQVVLSGLPRGKPLRLLVKAANHDGVWSEEYASLDLYVVPPFWERSWFRLLMVGLLVLAVLGYNLWRLKAIRWQNLRLQEEVAKATAELKTRHEELADANQQLHRANDELAEQSHIIKRQMVQLNELYQAQANFFANLAHDFRAPLTLILGYLEELIQADDYQRAERFHRIARNIQLNARQLQNLINQIMDIVKLKSGQYKLQVSSGQVGPQVASITEAFQLLAERKDITLSYAQDERLPLLGCYDADVISKVVYNLLSNAIKFTPESGRVALSLTLAQDLPDELRSQPRLAEGAVLKLQIEDSGVGIPEQELPHIFDRFYQARGAEATQHGGAGLGLALVKQLVELHLGIIEVESQQGVGTCFTLWLPISAQAFPEALVQSDANAQGAAEWAMTKLRRWMPPSEAFLADPPASAPEEGQRGQGAGSPGEVPARILVVEDNEQIRAFICEQLAGTYEVSYAEQGELAWKATLKQAPDLIISDVMMPVMDGLQLTQRLKQDLRTCHIPLILLTALDSKEHQLSGLTTGADAYLTKPFHKKELLVRIEQLLAGRKLLWKQFLHRSNTRELPANVQGQDREFLEQLHAFLDKNISNPQLNVDMVGEAMGMSRTPLFTKLKGLTGLSAMQYVRDYRLRKAFELLQTHQHTVSEIIYLTGFNSPTYFYRAFKEKYGSSPKTIQKTR